MKPVQSLKNYTRLLGVLSLLLFVNQAQAGALGTLILGGSGCTVPTGNQKLTAISGQDSRYMIPLQVAITKTADAALMRKTCNFRLPIDLATNEKVVVSNVSQWVRLGASKGAQVKTNLEVFMAGAHGNPLTTEVKAIDTSARLFQTVRAEGVVAESKCGDTSGIISGNLSALATGNAQATAALGNLQLTIKIVNCN